MGPLLSMAVRNVMRNRRRTFITLAALAATVGLAIVLALYRVKRTIYADEVNLLKW